MIGKFYLYRWFLTLAFFYSTFVVFLQSKGLSLTQIMFIFSIHSATALILEVPGGALADRFSKRKSIIWGTLGIALSFLVNGLGFEFWHFSLAAIIGGIGWSLVSGADSALVHSSLEVVGKKGEYSKIYGRSTSISRLANALGGFLGGFLYPIAHGLPLLATACSTIVAFFIALTFKNSTIKSTDRGSSLLKTIRDSLFLIKSHPQLLWLTIFTSFLTAFIWTVNVTIQPYMTLIGIPVQYFGAILAVIAIVGAITASFLHKFKKYHSEGYLLVVLATVALAMIFMGLQVGMFSLLLFALIDSGAVIGDVLVTEKVLGTVNENQKATILSFQNFGVRLVNIISNPLIGWVSDKYGLNIGLTISGGVLLGAFTLLVLLKSIRPNSTSM